MYIPECYDNTYIEIYENNNNKIQLFMMDQSCEDFGVVLKLFYDYKNHLRYVYKLTAKTKISASGMLKIHRFHPRIPHRKEFCIRFAHQILPLSDQAITVS